MGASEGLFVASMSVRHTVGITSGARSHRSARRVAALAARVHRQQVALHFLMVAPHANLGHAAWRIMTRWRAGQCHACSRRRSRLRPSADRWTRSCDSDWCFRSQLSGAEMDRYGSMGWGWQRCAKSAKSIQALRPTHLVVERVCRARLHRVLGRRRRPSAAAGSRQLSVPLCAPQLWCARHVTAGA